MDSGDRRLHLIGPHRALREGSRYQSDPLFDLPLVPKAAVLVGERDELPTRAGTGAAAGIGEQHQRKEALGFTVFGPETAQLTRAAS